jgi:hypothetical protein
MRGRRPGKTGGVFAGIHRGFFRAENDADGRGSLAAVERSMSDRLLGGTPHVRRGTNHFAQFAQHGQPRKWRQEH